MSEPEPGPIVFWKPDPDAALLRICGPDNEPVVSIAQDGTVTVYKEGGDKLAAKIFWDSLQVYGQTQEQRIKAAEVERDALRAVIASVARDCRLLSGDPSFKEPLNIPFLAMARRLEDANAGRADGLGWKSHEQENDHGT